uniref:AIG1-type G domain-containing protein n=1 Tax=Panagrolaimus sp. JU765 TaxID=591449 RepID=A0AC34RPC5_9BILA
MEIAQVGEVEKDLNNKLTKANDNQKMMEKDNQKLNAQIAELQKELKAFQSIGTEALEENKTLTEQNQGLKRETNENKQTINNLQMEIARLLNNKLTKSDDNEKMMEEQKQKMNAEITKLGNKIKTHESEFNETLKGITILTEENQQLKTKNNENEQTINNLRMEITQLLEVEKNLNDKLTKANEMVEKEKQKPITEITKLQNELKTYQTIINEGYDNSDNLRQQYQELEARNNENEQIIDSLHIEIARLLELNDELTKANGRIEKLENPKMYTIVVVGATGVGKSTLISAMENYLKWPKLEDAAKHLNELEIRIPVQFTVTRKTGQSQVVTAGFAEDKKQKNENFNNSGESVTQKPKVHLFKFGNDTVRIIDTPGLADTRGSDQDEINLKLIQKMVKSQEQIHGICIFIKSNDSKLTPQFEMTVRQLLSVFPKSALNNVFFFFTHCVGTFFAVGDVMNPLKELQKKYGKSHGSTFSLEWNRMHCVDSEGFRYLVCRKQEVEYSTRPETDFYYAWDESSKEITKFFETVKTIQPIPANQIEASRKLGKWTDAMKQKESSAKPEQEEPYFHLMDCLKFMTNKHTLVLNKSELKTNIEVLSKNEFCEAIDEFLNVAEDGGRTLQKCKDIVKTLESG